MDIGRAFAFVFDDDEWIKKILIGGLITLIPLIGGFVAYGYMIEIVRRIYAEGDERLPEWDDFGGYLTRGFVLVVGTLIWFLPIFIVMGCLVALLAATTSTSDGDGVAVLGGLMLFGLVSVMVLLIPVWAAVFLPILIGRYAIEQRFGAMFEFSEIIAEVRRVGAGPLLMLFVTYLAASVVGQLGFIACFIGVIFTAFYADLVVAHAAGQVYRRARGLGDIAQPSQAPAF